MKKGTEKGLFILHVMGRTEVVLWGITGSEESGTWENGSTAGNNYKWTIKFHYDYSLSC